jgi:hypothetical protein
MGQKTAEILYLMTLEAERVRLSRSVYQSMSAENRSGLRRTPGRRVWQVPPESIK